MKPARFDYHAPTALADALDILHTHNDDAKVLAGGQSLVPMLALRLTRFDHLVDVQHVAQLSEVSGDNGTTRVGAMTTQTAIERSDLISERVPLLHRATPFIGHHQIRNRGTLGGSVCHADPASEYPAVLLALGAQLEIASKAGQRTVPAVDFFDGTWSTVLDPSELLTAVTFPVWSGRSGFAIDEVARRRGDFALVGAAAAITVDDDDRVTRLGLGLFGVGSTPVDVARTAGIEGSSVSSLTDDVLQEVGEAIATALDPPADVHASSQYRRRVAAHLIPKVLRRAAEEATRG